MALFNLGQYAEAIRSFDRVPKPGGDRDEVDRSGSDLALFEGRSAGREKKPLKFDVLNEIILTRRAALLHLGRYAEAQENFEQVLEIDSGNIPVLQQSSMHSSILAGMRRPTAA